MVELNLSPEMRAKIAEIRAIDNRLRGYSKECLVQALSVQILTRADILTPIDGNREVVIEREFERIDQHKKGARFENAHRRLQARLASIQNPKSKRRRRRRIRTVTVEL